MKIAIGCDEAALGFKESMKAHLLEKGHEVEDFGVHDERPVLYPDIAHAVARGVADHQYERAVLVCGTGIGMCIAANKVPGVRAAVCHDPFSAERARKSNNAQVLCMGARIIAPELGKMLTDLWLSSDFTGGGSAEKVDKISYYEEIYMKERTCDHAENHQ